MKTSRYPYWFRRLGDAVLRGAQMLIPLKHACRQVFLSVSGYRARERRGMPPFPTYTLPGSNRRYVQSEDVEDYLSMATAVSVDQTDGVKEWVKNTMRGLGYETS